MQKLRTQILNLAFEKQSESTVYSPKANGQIEALKQETKDIKSIVDRFKEDLALKANIKDVCVLVDIKADSEEVQRQIEDTQRMLKMQILQVKSQGIEQ